MFSYLLFLLSSYDILWDICVSVHVYYIIYDWLVCSTLKTWPCTLGSAAELNLTSVTKYGLLWPMEYNGDDSSWFLVRSQISSAVSALSLGNATWEVRVGSSWGGKKPWRGKKSMWSYMQASYEQLRLPFTSALLRWWRDQQEARICTKRLT